MTKRGAIQKENDAPGSTVQLHGLLYYAYRHAVGWKLLKAGYWRPQGLAHMGIVGIDWRASSYVVQSLLLRYVGGALGSSHGSRADAMCLLSAR